MMTSDESVELLDLSPDLYTSLLEKKPLLHVSLIYRELVNKRKGRGGQEVTRIFQRSIFNKATQYTKKSNGTLL